jgi:hypothetical protein
MDPRMPGKWAMACSINNPPNANHRSDLRNLITRSLSSCERNDLRQPDDIGGEVELVGAALDIEPYIEIGDIDAIERHHILRQRTRLLRERSQRIKSSKDEDGQRPGNGFQHTQSSHIHSAPYLKTRRAANESEQCLPCPRDSRLSSTGPVTKPAICLTGPVPLAI